ncbi:MAG: phage holin family protein [Kofleriaceae bacterium]
MATPRLAITEASHEVGDLLHRVTDDVKTIARDEIELVVGELQRSSKEAAINAAVALLGGVVALVGLGMLCMVVVAALEPVIPQLWLRLLIMAVIYLALGIVIAILFAKRLRREAVPDTKPAQIQAKETVQSIKQGLRS